MIRMYIILICATLCGACAMPDFYQRMEPNDLEWRRSVGAVAPWI